MQSITVPAPYQQGTKFPFFHSSSQDIETTRTCIKIYDRYLIACLEWENVENFMLCCDRSPIQLFQQQLWVIFWILHPSIYHNTVFMLPVWRACLLCKLCTGEAGVVYQKPFQFTKSNRVFLFVYELPSHIHTLPHYIVGTTPSIVP